MIKTTVTIVNQLGLHARASAKLVSTALRFQSSLLIVKGSQKANGKSIMAVMTLGAPKGAEVSLEIDGPDEEAMSQALVKLIEEKFGEAQ